LDYRLPNLVPSAMRLILGRLGSGYEQFGAYLVVSIYQTRLIPLKPCFERASAETIGGIEETFDVDSDRIF
jgi:hypothetical protein